MLAPRHFAYVDKTFYAGSNLEECTVVSHNDNFAFNLVANLKVCVKCIPWMGMELFEAEGDTFFVVVEVEDNDVELLVESHNLAGVVYAAPREVGDVDKTIYATEVDEYAVRSDVLDGAFEYLTFFEFRDDFAFLLLELGFDKSLVRYNNVAELFVDFNDTEFHCLANEDIVVTDGLNVDLRTGEECLDAEDVNDHATFCAAFDVTLDDFVVFEGGVDTLPRAACACFLVRKDELTFAVFLILDENFHFVADLDVGVVAELAHGDNAVRFVVDVNHSLTFVEGDDGTFDYFFVFYGIERFLIGVLELFVRTLTFGVAMLVCFPIEICDRRIL